MPAGWSGISSYLIPENSNPDQLLSPISNELIILQNFDGVYWPQEGLNTIGNWNYLDGYTIKLNNAATLEFTGTIPENRIIEMMAGWSLIPVLSFNPVPATDFDPLESLSIIKEVAGTGVYWPVYNINTLQELQPGKSYLIGILNSQGYCAGFVTINNLTQSRSFAVFGDDPTTNTNEGFSSGEKMEFRLWRSATNETFPLEISFDKLLPDQEYFAVDGLSAISELKFGEILPGNFSSGEISVYPNPAGDFIKISSDWPISRIEISDAIGVIFLTSKPKNPTYPEVDLSTLQTGMYYVKIITNGNTTIRKVIKQ